MTPVQEMRLGAAMLALAKQEGHGPKLPGDPRDKPRGDSVTRVQQLVAANPDCTLAFLAAQMGCSKETVSGYLATLRLQAPLVTERRTVDGTRKNFYSLRTTKGK